MSGGLCIWMQPLAVAKKSFLFGKFAQLIMLDDMVFLRSCGQWPDLCSSWLSFLAAHCSLMLQRETVTLRADNLSSLLVPSPFLCRLSGVKRCVSMSSSFLPVKSTVKELTLISERGVGEASEWCSEARRILQDTFSPRVSLGSCSTAVMGKKGDCKHIGCTTASDHGHWRTWWRPSV